MHDWYIFGAWLMHSLMVQVEVQVGAWFMHLFMVQVDYRLFGTGWCMVDALVYGTGCIISLVIVIGSIILLIQGGWIYHSEVTGGSIIQL
jgi:hypothetical protein